MQAKYLLFFRAALFEVLLLQTVYAPSSSIHRLGIWALLATYAALALSLCALDRHRRIKPAVNAWAFLIDVAITSVILFFTEELSNDLYIAYFLVILASCFLEDLAHSFTVGIVSCIVYGALTFPGKRWFEQPFYLLHTSFLLVSSFFSAYVAHTVKQVERDTAARYEDKMAWLQRLSMIGQALAGVLHEVKTPVNTVILSVEYAREMLHQGKNKDVEEQLELINQEAERVGEILANYLEFSKPSTLRLLPTSLHAPLRHVLDAMKVHAKDREIAFDVELGEDVCIQGSENHLMQVFTNLLMNAFEAMPLGGRLLVRQESGIGVVRLSITDTGVGIDDAVKPHLFEAFATSRLDDSGHGLGLSIVRWIVEKHSGDIRISSKGPGKGTRIDLAFPVISPASALTGA